MQPALAHDGIPIRYDTFSLRFVSVAMGVMGAAFLAGVVYAMVHVRSTPGWSIGVALFFLAMAACCLWGLRWALKSVGRVALVVRHDGLVNLVRGEHRAQFMAWNDMGRVVVTRPRMLWQRGSPAVFIQAKDPAAGLAQMGWFRRLCFRHLWWTTGVRATMVVPQGLEYSLEDMATRFAELAGIEPELKCRESVCVRCARPDSQSSDPNRAT